jgi:prepilin-type N-terminal cleavage/methylation domain-containing protein
MARRQKQSGFTVVEVLLVLILIAIVAFAGYYVWHSQKDTDKTLEATNKSSAQKSPSADDSSGQQADRLTLDSGKVSFVKPKGWTNTAAEGACRGGDGVSCVDHLFLSPSDADKTQSGDAFGISVSAFDNAGGKKLSDWYWSDYSSGEVQTSDDTVSSKVINGNEVYQRTQTTNSYVDKYYAVRKGDTAVVIYSRVSETHYTPGGASVDSHADNTRYQPQIDQIVSSVSIKE